MSKQVPKYRPYLSLEEIQALLDLLEPVENKTPTLLSSQASLLKTHTLASLSLKGAAYVTNPRKTLSEKLDFTPTVPISVPDFSEMLDSLENLKTGE